MTGKTQVRSPQSSGAATPELETIAGDTAVESRVRVLAFNRLRAMKRPVPTKQLLGTIIEFPQPDGLDTLAAFVDGGCVTSTKRDIPRYSRVRRPGDQFPRRTS